METKFVNRKMEFNQIKELTKNAPKSQKGKLLLLYSKAGIGKARLVEEYVAKYYPVSLTINVKIPTSKNSVTPSYHYFKALFNQLKECLNNTINYKISSPDIGISIKAFSIGVSLEKITEMPKDIVKKIKHVQKFFRTYDQIVIISIENIQSIDGESLDIMKSLLNDFPNIFMFLQYTIDNQHTKSDLCSVFEYLQEFSVCKQPVGIKKMNPEHILKILHAIKGEEINESRFLEYYIKYDGNIDELIICSLEETNILPHDPYKLVVNEKISQDARFILYIILFHKGELYKDVLLRLLIKNTSTLWDYNRLDLLCQELELYHIANVENDKIIINNSAIKNLENSTFPEEAYVAFRIVENHCYECLKSDDGKTDALYRLIYIYFLFNDEQIIKLLPYIKERLVSTKNIRQIIGQIEDICNHNNKNINLNYKLSLGIVDILYAIGDMQMAKRKLNTIFQENNLQHEMYNLALKGVLNEKDFSNYYKTLRKKYESLIRVELFCKYINLYHKMKYSSSTEAKNYAKEILATDKYKPFIEYYFVLKNYSTYIDNNSAINALQQCVDAFENQGRNDLAIRTKITLAMRNANIGNLETARIILKEAQKENIYSCRECYFLNNFSVIDILDEKFTPNVENNLKNALLFIPSQYEQGIILCNLLIYYSKTKDFEKAKDIAAQLEMPQYQQYMFEQYNHIIHYNLYYYYSVIDDTQKTNQHYMELEKLSKVCPLELKEYMDATIFRKTKLPHQHRRYFYSNYPYRPDYIGYWQLEIPDFTVCYPEYF